MTPERWQQVNDLFQAVAECEPEQRIRFLQTACQGDEALFREVKSLIISHESAEDFIETPAFETAPELLTSKRAAGATIGELIGRYRIESRIGVGGMGEVYLARDEQLGRKVALKFLPERLTADKTQLSRFKSEARAASALNHPNILTVYEIGTDGKRYFIATEFIEGETLSASLMCARMSVEEALDIAVQVASALDAAHRAGVVHRDIKPDNIMLRPDGYVKVLDFGIAKLTEPRSASDLPEARVANTQLTQTGLIVGTPRYMSPEQMRGQSADARSDIWSLGLVFYEMLGGVPPFSGSTATDSLAPILKKQGTAGVELQSILHKALRREREDRYQTIAEMLSDLRSLKAKLEQEATPAPKRKTSKRWLALAAAIVVVSLAILFLVRYRSLSGGTAPASAVSVQSQIPAKSIAVLPFDNRSHDPDNAFFTDGVQDEILTDLARIAALKVISRTSVMQYQSGAKRNLRQIANELRVAHVVEGSVQRAGNRVRVNAQLIDARTDAHLWAQTYDRDLADVFAIQSEIAKAIADQLQAKLSPDEKSEIEQPPTIDVTAFDFYSHAKNLLLNASGSSTGKPDLLQAVDLLNQAVARDPAFFDAYCQVAYAHASLYFFDFDRTPSRLAAAEGAVETAARLRPEAGETHLARARNLYWGHSDYDGALAELEIARQRLPSDNGVFSLKGYIERRQGRWDDSIRDLERAIALDPRNILTLQQTARSYSLLHRYAESKSLLARVLSFEPNDPVTRVLHAFVDLDSNANAQPMHEVIDSIRRTNPAALPNVSNNWLLCSLAQRNAAAARLALAACRENPIVLSSNENVIFPHSFAEGLIARLDHDEEKARAAFAAAHVEQEKIVQVRANYGPALCVLGLIDAALGRKEQALAEGRRAVELVRAEKDAVVGPTTIKYLAIIAAWIGDTDLACNELATLIRDPSGVSYGQLKLMPFWDPLRGDPRFEKILEEAKEPVSGERTATAATDKSIAVLPFENLSRDPDNAFFTDGVQDEILTDLARVADLKVISRTSVMQYKTGAKRNLRQIGNELGVAHVVEGGVQRVGNRVRVNAQLIDARTDAHLWAQTYDRNLSDVFAIQSEIARAIADQLQANLSPSEKSAIEQPPTSDITAFAFYTHAKSLLLTAVVSSTIKEDLQQAVDLLNQAVVRDPSFLQAYCELGYAHDLLYFFGFDRSQARLGQAEAAIQVASRLGPDAGETHVARAQHLYWGYRDYTPALAELEIAGERLPNDSRVLQLTAFIERRQGRWRDAIQDLKRASVLDPRNVLTLSQTAQIYQTHRRYDEEKSILDQLLAFEPNDAATKVQEAFAELNLKAETQPLHQMVDSTRATNPAALPSIAGNWLICAVAERDAAAAKDALTAAGENPISFDQLENIYFNRPFVEGAIARMTKDDARARTAFVAARAEQEKLVRAGPDNAGALCVLGLIDAALGRKEEALSEGRHAVELLPVEKDAQTGPQIHKYLAMIAAWIGDKDLACEHLAIAISKPSGLSYGQLKLLSFWDPLRGDPRFEKLVEQAKQPIALVNSPAPEETLNVAPEKSIAVLPFENRSSDPENAFFTDGVQDEILTDLARVADLKVISRTSVMQYKTGAKRNLRQIGNELGVAHVLEGGVQRVGNRVRVNAQLINARTDAHLWAQTYDRDLADVFAIQSEIAKTIADQLQAKLSPREKSAIEQVPTTDITAFNLYSHAKNLFLTAFAGANGEAELLQAADLLKQALARDPRFFQAYCQLAFTEINIYGVANHRPEYLAQAEAALDSAARLRPDAGETHLARARNLYWGYLDYDGALHELEIARQTLPGDDWAFSLQAYIERRQGRWQECIRDLERATELDPRNVLTLQQLALTYDQLRRYEEEKLTYERILAFEPNDPVTKSNHAFVELDSKGDPRPLHEVTKSIRHQNPAAAASVADNWLLCALAERDTAAARNALTTLGDNPPPLGPIADVRFNRPFMEAVIARVERDEAKARAAFMAARAEQEKTAQAQPNYAPAWCALGLIDAGLGRKEEALREGRHAVELCPIEKDAFIGAAMVKYLAMIAAWAGEKDLACQQLAITIGRPGDLSYGQLKLMPFWDPLRGDPRFEKLVASLGPKDIN